MIDSAVPGMTHDADRWDNAETLQFDGLSICGRTRMVTKDGAKQRLTNTEFDLLFFLASNPGQVFTREELMNRVWDYSTPMDCSTVTVHVRRLREKVEGSPDKPRFIKTVWGTGYKFEG
ncbi:MAG: response regulator transcription factor [Chloroflexota bacterium]|nr:response regulator transcription factor [Chloroflexota bacterium]MDE2941828.1 response regulator transcription factor [Chloroflexota bacterium]MDE3266861.1 response regulator transcription factor [Chloroflexota bacterium]